eukprot:TRINITY_DN1227_c2_g1_i2.p1 TRINITY_DN1227_c2_g1~~TRINITY_DN1227_c2_g1_i2.p1  ORF type:complete len:147 (-),score=26.60 TRINITY_DN1227_c2_g1_i2:117-557(-)
MASSSMQIDAALIGSDGKIMLGDMKAATCIHISEVDTILQKYQTMRQKTGKPIPDDMKKAMHYCRRFKPLRNDANALKAKTQILRMVDFDGKSGRRCHDFEAAQLLNLMPSSGEEARKLIPTIANSAFVEELVKEIQPMRDFDRAI